MDLKKIERVLASLLERTLGPNMAPMHHAGKPREQDVEAVKVLMEIRAELGIKASSSTEA